MRVGKNRKNGATYVCALPFLSVTALASTKQNLRRPGHPWPTLQKPKMENPPFKTPFIEALIRLSEGCASVPKKEEPLKQQLDAAQTRLIQACFGLGLAGAGAAEVKEFQDGIGAVRLACYSYIRHYNQLIELMDTANREVSAIVKKCSDNEPGKTPGKS